MQFDRLSVLHAGGFLSYNLTMPSALHYIRQCSRLDCQFRYPADACLKRAHLCPKCGAEAPAMVEIQPNSSPERSSPLGQNTVIEAMLDNIRSTFNVGAIFRTAD
ncbi:MAG: hypothetical protein Q7U74_01890, partial [Saprospiraceae bacterium]|nr:hypothetical protein [Saprospiraceae bacterium]